MPADPRELVVSATAALAHNGFLSLTHQDCIGSTPANQSWGAGPAAVPAYCRYRLLY